MNVGWRADNPEPCGTSHRNSMNGPDGFGNHNTLCPQAPKPGIPHANQEKTLRPCHPHRAALQMACDAPTSSRMAAHAAQLPYRPDATCLSKEDSWPPLLATVWGHSGSVTCVAFSSCGGFFVSGSRDTSLR